MVYETRRRVDVLGQTKKLAEVQVKQRCYITCIPLSESQILTRNDEFFKDKAPVQQPFTTCDTTFKTWVLYLNGPSEFGLFKAQPEQASDGHADTQPGEETEEVDDGEDVLRDGVQHGQ